MLFSTAARSFAAPSAKPPTILLNSPSIGGRTFGQDLQQDVLRVGFLKVPSSVSSYILRRDDRITRASIITDDLIISGSKSDVDYSIEQLRAKREFTGGYDPDRFNGMAIRRDRNTKAITLSCPAKIHEMAKLLEITNESKIISPYVASSALDEVMLKRKPPGEQTPILTDEQKLCQAATGCGVFITKARIDVIHPIHRATRVMSNPPVPATTKLLKGTARYLLGTVNDGITFGGVHDESNDNLRGELAITDAYDMERPAGKSLAGSSDTTWAHTANGSVATKCFTYNHGTIFAAAHSIPSVQLSSNEAETWGLAGAEATGIHIINLATEFGKPPHGPVPMRVDNSIAVKQAREECEAKGSRHYLRRVAFTQENERAGLFKTSHVSTDHMPSDFLGKWVANDKYNKSRKHVLNLGAQVPM